MFGDVQKLLTFAAAFGKTFFEATPRRVSVVREGQGWELKKFFNSHLQISNKALLLPSLSERVSLTRALERLNTPGKGLRAIPIQFFDLLSILKTAGILLIGRST